MFHNMVLTGFADEIDADLTRQIQVMKKLGIGYIEMRGVNGKGLVEHSVRDAVEIKKRLDAEGMKLSAIGSPIGKIMITDAFEPHMELFRYTVKLAHLMETPYIRMFSFFIPQGEQPEQYSGAVMERLGQFVEYAQKNDVILLHENEKEIYGDSIGRCQEIMKTFYGEHFQAVFDFANFVQCEQDTREAYEALSPYISYIHVKDARWGTGTVVPAGQGDGHVEELLGRLKASGYHGFLSLEPHLADFDGFSALEDGRSMAARKMTGEEAFTLAYRSLMEIGKRL